MSDAWDPTQYEKFRDQRKLPFFDLAAWIRPCARILDLGCGTAELTAELADRLGATAHGVDNSPAMLSRAKPHPRVTLEQRDLAGIHDVSGYDLLFSHAALQWVEGNEALLRRWLPQLRPGAQVAIQVPKNHGHPSHTVSAEIARSPEFRDRLSGYVNQSHALILERYAELLFEHGFREQQAMEKIYGHVLPETAAVVEWVKGTHLTAYLERLSPEEGARFVERYRARLVEVLGDRRPYFYPFRRALVWGVKSE